MSPSAVPTGKAEKLGSLWPAFFSVITFGVLLIPGVRSFFQAQNVTWLYTLCISTTLAYGLTPVVIRISFWLGWLDAPQGRKAHDTATPLLGGLSIVAAFGLALLISYHYSLPMKGVGIAGLFIWLVGAIDDRWEIPAKLKLLAQLIAIGILFVFGVHVTFLPNTLWGDIGEYVITILWVMGITNAVNFLDGMDGLAPGMSAIIAFFLAVVAIQTGQPYFAFVAMAMLGATIGFLPYNFRWGRNARIFLGDNGSTFIGFVLASAVIMGNWAENATANIFIPLLLMGVPIFDMTMTTVVRFGTKRVRTFGEWLAYVGRDHLHHRLASLGIGRGLAVIVIWGVTFFLGVSAVLIKEVEGIFLILLIVQVAVFFLFFTFFMLYVRKHQLKLFVTEISNRNSSKVSMKELGDLLSAQDKPGKTDSDKN